MKGTKLSPGGYAFIARTWVESVERGGWWHAKSGGEAMLARTARGGTFEVACFAMWQHCSRCRLTQDDALGTYTVCSVCELVSPSWFRTVSVISDCEPRTLDRLVLIAKGIGTMHPAHLPDETTVINLADWNNVAGFKATT